jgi:hypothetical protein
MRAEMYRNATNNQSKSASFLDSYTRIAPEQKKEDGRRNSGEQGKLGSARFKVVYGDAEYANSDVYAEAEKRRKALADNCADCQKTVLAATTSARLTTSGTSTANRTGATNVVATNATNKTGVITYSNSTYADAAAINAAANRADAASGRAANQSTIDQHTDFYAHLLDPDRKLIRTEGISYINEYDKANLKKYNVIIAALSKFEGTERLKKSFEVSGENLVIVRNDVGLYYVIIGSYDIEEQAVNKLRSIELEYNSRFTVAELKKLYGIPFTDLWILRR